MITEKKLHHLINQYVPVNNVAYSALLKAVSLLLVEQTKNTIDVLGEVINSPEIDTFKKATEQVLIELKQMEFNPICFDNHYKPLPVSCYIAKSEIEGHGIFTNAVLPKGNIVGLSHKKIEEQLFRTPLGGYLNHSYLPNCHLKEIDEDTFLITNRVIVPSTELTIDYRTHECGAATCP